ncbi:transcriptional regulator of RNA polII, SAGA, subunit-domain-containing protein [Spinellus fusiger]|nr:transcriptional regulator of RNA polII, SAGA, subunit-domain-containing protein [Spinellus fusiger]
MTVTMAAPTINASTEKSNSSHDTSHSQKYRDRQQNHFSQTIANGRQDVIALKQQLADALGENGQLYWDALRDFIVGKLNRQEFDFYASLYLSRQHAHLHNAFILSTIHNAQISVPPPSRDRAVGWAKRKRGKEGALDHDQGQDPRKRKLKMDVMALSKTERDRLKMLVKTGDKDRLKPFVDTLLGPRVGQTPSLPLSPSFNADYARGLLAPLCSDLKELPNAQALHSRMTSSALENGLLGGVTEDTVHAMLFATEATPLPRGVLIDPLVSVCNLIILRVRILLVSYPFIMPITPLTTTLITVILIAITLAITIPVAIVSAILLAIIIVLVVMAVVVVWGWEIVVVICR